MLKAERQAQQQALRASLRDEGLPVAYINRLTEELNDHYADLEHEAVAAGREVEIAGAEALRRLGGDESIAAAVLTKPELRSWSCNNSWVLGLIRPLLMLLLLPVLPIYACLDQGPAIARWGVSISVGTLLTGGLLFALARTILLAI
jgi:hypothetical protein